MSPNVKLIHTQSNLIQRKRQWNVFQQHWLPLKRHKELSGSGGSCMQIGRPPCAHSWSNKNAPEQISPIWEMSWGVGRVWLQHMPNPDSLHGPDLSAWINADLCHWTCWCRCELTHFTSWGFYWEKMINAPLSWKTSRIQKSLTGKSKAHAHATLDKASVQIAQVCVKLCDFTRLQNVWVNHPSGLVRTLVP